MLDQALGLIEVAVMQRRPTSKTRGSSREGIGSGGASPVQRVWDADRNGGSASRSEILLAGQSLVLELLAKGAGLETVLTELVRTIERCSPDMLCSVLLYDSASRCLRQGAAPSLPAEYNAAVDGVSIGPAAGSCGTAAYNRKRVVVEDISNDLLWADYRAIALEHNLKACWSQPVLSSAGDVLGTFAMYYDSPRGPTEEEIELIERAAYLAGIAIERTRSDDTVRENEERFRQLAETVRRIT
ncbi:MAG: GAF domain-containing protein, partial [Planctomycetes bacterium]|nr:GAF domain-containing protein [Planctomycetota bacterium]